jgi:DNA sulfur modification protein DndD
MPIQMRILGWETKGLRCPDHKIDLRSSNGEPHKVSLIQMPNGTGKTTTLNLLRAALSGSLNNIKKYKKKEGGANHGRFEVRLALNGRQVTVIMYFDFESETVSYKTTRGRGQVEGFDPPTDFRRFMDENFVNFYIFDGELAKSLLKSDETNAEAVVEHLFQINKLSALSRKVQEYWNRKTQGDTATEERGLVRRTNKVDELRKRLKELRRDKRKLEKKKTKIETQLATKRSEYQKEIQKETQRGEQIASAEKKLTKSEELARAQAKQALDLITIPYALSAKFADSMYELKNSLDRVKLPESAAREFFVELADEEECICEREIDANVREVILRRASQYLGSDDVSLLNSIKSSVDDAVGRSRTEGEKDLNKKLKELEKLVLDERSARTKLDELTHQAEQGDPAVKKASERIRNLEGELEIIDDELEKYESENDKRGIDDTYGIGVMERRLENAEDKLAQIAQTVELKKKRNVLMKILSQAELQAKAGITSEVCKDANTRIRKLMPHNNISIEKIDHCLVLEGQSGGSAGEELSIAYAFLSTLFHRSDHQLPFVVDSPTGPTDFEVRPEIGKLVPNLSDQFIAFIISSERETFVSYIKEACTTPLLYVTLFRKGPRKHEKKAREMPSYSETVDGICVPGEEFFNQFQLEKQ